MSVSVAVDCRSLLSEGPVFADGTLYWVDIPGQLFSFLPAGATDPTTVHFDTPVSAVIPIHGRPGSVLLCLGRSIVIYDIEKVSSSLFLLVSILGCASNVFYCVQKTQQTLATVDEDAPANRLNDAKCDPV